MKKLPILAIAFLFTAAAAAAQSAPQNPPEQAKGTPTFSSRTELVLVPALVTEHGAHVPGLTKDDFTVLENGVERKVATLEEFKPVTTPVARPKADEPGVFTNQQPANFAPRRVNIIVLDTINTAFLDQTRARAQIIKFLSQSVTTNDLTSLLVLTRGGFKVIHNFTTDPAVLVQALQRVKGKTDAMSGENVNSVYTDPMAGTDAVSAEAASLEDFMEHMEAQATRMQQEFAILSTLDAFRAIASTYGGIPGRKALVWVTGSFPFFVPKPGDEPSARDFTSDFEHVFMQLNSANVALYPIDARGLVTVGFTASDTVPASAIRRGGAGMARAQTAMMDRHVDTLNTMNTFADMTGGRAYYNTNDLSKAIARASEDSSAYYVLGYYINADEGKPGWRKLQVKVKRGGVQVHARSGFYFTHEKAADPDQMRLREMVSAVNSPFEFTALPLSVRWTQQAPADGGRTHVRYQIVFAPGGFSIDEGDQNHVDLELLTVPSVQGQEKEPQGVSPLRLRYQAHIPPKDLPQLEAGGMSYDNQLDLPKGQYSVKFVVRDNISGRIGSLSAPVAVQ